jgi:hypothetical protein
MKGRKARLFQCEQRSGAELNLGMGMIGRVRESISDTPLSTQFLKSA